MRPEALMQWSVAHFQGASEFLIVLVKRQGAKTNHVGLSFIISIVPGTRSNHFNWMIPNFHIGCGCLTEHLF